MSRDKLVMVSREQRSSSRASSSSRRQQITSTRPDKPSPIPEVGQITELPHKQIVMRHWNILTGAKQINLDTFDCALQEEESVVARNTDGSIQLRLDQVNTQNQFKSVLNESSTHKEISVHSM